MKLEYDFQITRATRPSRPLVRQAGVFEFIKALAERAGYEIRPAAKKRAKRKGEA